MAKPTILITGAMGIIAWKVVPELKKRYDLRLLDVKDINTEGEKVDDVIKADLLDSDRASYREYFRDVHAVIHSGFVRDSGPEHGDARFWAELDNVRMAYNVYRTCIEENVRRLVVISSNHAADFYESLILDGKILSIGPETYPRSDNFYGWAKISYEALGLAFATGRLSNGKKLSNVQLRIGAPRETDIDACKTGDLRKMKRDLGAYLSLRDEVQLIEKSIEEEDIDNQYGIPFQIFYGVSGNTHNFWSIENAKQVIGYSPEDDSSRRFAEQVAKITGVKHT